jgi:hypothetical protein
MSQIKSEGRKDLFWLMVSIHSHLIPWLLGLWQGRNALAEVHSRGKLLTSWRPGSRERESIRVRDKIHPSKVHPQ